MPYSDAQPSVEPVIEAGRQPPSEPGTDTGPKPVSGRPVLAPMPRRKQINKGASTASTLSLPPKRHYEAPTWKVVGRLMAWLWQVLKFFSTSLYYTVTNKKDPEGKPVRVRKMLESMGPTAIKMGQQLSIRADLLAHQYCDELSKMLDSVPPFPTELAIGIVEKSIGGPLENVFQSFDPVPIGSASLACVYQARLHTGDLVAVKVKRPGIGVEMAMDLKAISWLCRMAEMIGVVRTGLTKNFQLELARMLTEELDFTLEARYTEIFRQDTENHKYVSAPQVYFHISNFDVLVTEFVSGVFLGEILYAIERKDRKSLDELLARGFRPKLIARRMQQIFYWECFESRFFHADPHPSNIIVRPDNTLVMIDFGSCGSVSSRMRRKLLSFNRFMMRDDLHGMVQTTISMLEPLPHFDVESFSQDLMNVYREGFIAHKSKKAPWYDKCSGGMWMKVIILSQKYHLPMTLDTVRIFRANFLYDSIVFRLWVDTDPQKEFGRWADSMNRKNKRKVLRQLRDRFWGPLDEDFTKQRELHQLWETALERIQHFLDEPRYSFALTIGKMAYVFTVILKSALVLVGFLLVISAARVLYIELFGHGVGVSIFQAIQWAFNDKLVLSSIFVVSLMTVRKLLMKLQDVETK